MVTVTNRNPRCYPFSMRISFEERSLLKRAALALDCSEAEVARIGLGPLFDKLRSETSGERISSFSSDGHGA